MSDNAEYLRDLLSLARMLRRFAEHHDDDSNHELFMSTAGVLEARAHAMALAQDCSRQSIECDAALHAPVDQMV